MSEVLAIAANYGQLVALLYLVFEVKDVRREIAAHLQIHHQPERRARARG